MSKKTLPFLSILFIIVIVSSACNFSTLTGGAAQPTVNTQATQDALAVLSAVQTATQMALDSQMAQIPTNTPVPTETPPPTSTPEPPTETPVPPTNTPEPTITPLIRLSPTATQTPLVVINPPPAPVGSPTPVPCNGARFVADVTVRDRTVFAANTPFTKTWKIRNTGTCTWTSSYDVVFVDGDRMGAPVIVDLPNTVPPGSEVDISIGMVAPSSMGTYRGNWKIKSDTGVLFGVGGSSAPFYVEIVVNTTATIVPRDYIYDFSANYCSATWTSGAGTLSCPGQYNDVKGFVIRLDRPQLETGQIDDEAGLITNPQAVTDGVIRGKFPAIKIKDGYHFKSIVGCDYSAKNCNVKFQLDYQIGDGAIQSLGSWVEANEGNYTKVDLDLSSLVGQDVKFILTVFANGEMNQDRALWLAPRIDDK